MLQTGIESVKDWLRKTHQDIIYNYSVLKSVQPSYFSWMNELLCDNKITDNEKGGTYISSLVTAEILIKLNYILYTARKFIVTVEKDQKRRI